MEYFWVFLVGVVTGGILTCLYAHYLINKVRAEIDEIRAKASDAIRKVTGSR